MIQVDPISVPHPGNLPPSDPAEFDFERASRLSHSEQPVPLGGVPRALREAAEVSGLDPLSELFNEALRYAQEGHLRLARERLQMLLCMAPDDGEARLMLARVHVAGQRWHDALSALDEAASCGVSIPMSLRRAVEDHLQAEAASREEHRSAVRAREQGEVKSLRGEARRLRSDNAHLTNRVSGLEREVRKWAWTTAGVAGIAIVFVGASLLFGGVTAATSASGAAAEAPVVVPGTPTEATDAPQVDPEETPEAPTPAAPTGLPGEAAAALDEAPGLEGTSFELRMIEGTLTVAGEVPTYRQVKTVERVLRGVAGADPVDLSGLVVLSRTQGATHVVEAGDTLSHIAYAYYGQSSLTKPIEKANGVDARSLRIGQSLVVPPID